MAEVLPAERLRGRFSGINLDDLVDWPVVRTWLYFGMFWLLVTPSIGVALSSLFNHPDYLGNAIGLTFGRLRPVHVNRVIFGAFSTLFIGECYYLAPAPVWRPRGLVATGRSAGLAMEYRRFRGSGVCCAFLGESRAEAGELPLFAEIPIFIVVATVTAQFLSSPSGSDWSHRFMLRSGT